MRFFKDGDDCACNGRKFFEYYGNAVICADCSDDESVLDILTYWFDKAEKLELENKELLDKITIEKFTK